MFNPSFSRFIPPLVLRPVIHFERRSGDHVQPACGVSLDLARGMTNVRKLTTCPECWRVSKVQ